MDVDSECKPHRSTEVAIDTQNKNAPTVSNGMDLRHTVKCEETVNGWDTVLSEQIKASNDLVDVEVDIVACTNTNETGSAQAEDPDATEYSSSFADTTSDTEKYSERSDVEVESQFFGDSELASPYDELGSLFGTRKKKLTNHWRSFIEPLMWRCKWTELKIREIECQELKYARALATYEQCKQSALYGSTSEEFCSKSMPFSNQYYRSKAIKRRRRRRVEAVTDIAAYMSRHCLFSYMEKRRSNPDATSMNNDFGNKAITGQHADCNDKFGLDDDKLDFEFGNADISLEAVLWQIEIVQFRVHKLKNQLDMTMMKNANKFSSSENLSLLVACDAQTISAPSPTFSAGNGEVISIEAPRAGTQHMSGYDIDNLVLPESAISSYGEAFHVPDIIESTVGLLSAADVSFHNPEIGDSCENIVDNVLIHNEAVDGGRDIFLGMNNQLIEKHLELEQGEEGEGTDPCPIPASEPDPMAKTMEPQKQSTLKSCLASDFQFPRNKRKRGERKAGTGSWSKQCSGEPNSQ
uniref:Uncharacterized protein LOC105628261 n=1 Tax=Rhizophora mucronata TaxID=61149 RepID=A0A2P2JAL7_RHIMU